MTRTPRPSLDGLPADVADELVQLEALDDEALRGVVHEVVAEDHDEIEAALEKNREGTLSDVERARLDALRQATDRTMLRKARAAVLLRFRGRQVPTVTESTRHPPQSSAKPGLREEWPKAFPDCCHHFGPPLFSPATPRSSHPRSHRGYRSRPACSWTVRERSAGSSRDRRARRALARRARRHPG